jgi:hypothetical protein
MIGTSASRKAKPSAASIRTSSTPPRAASPRHGRQQRPIPGRCASAMGPASTTDAIARAPPPTAARSRVPPRPPRSGTGPPSRAARPAAPPTDPRRAPTAAPLPEPAARTRPAPRAAPSRPPSTSTLSRRSTRAPSKRIVSWGSQSIRAPALTRSRVSTRAGTSPAARYPRSAAWVESTSRAPSPASAATRIRSPPVSPPAVFRAPPRAPRPDAREQRLERPFLPQLAQPSPPRRDPRRQPHGPLRPLGRDVGKAGGPVMPPT